VGVLLVVLGSIAPPDFPAFSMELYAGYCHSLPKPELILDVIGFDRLAAAHAGRAVPATGPQVRKMRRGKALAAEHVAGSLGPRRPGYAGGRMFLASPGPFVREVRAGIGLGIEFQRTADAVYLGRAHVDLQQQMNLAEA
jgi:hypothetical protein